MGICPPGIRQRTGQRRGRGDEGNARGGRSPPQTPPGQQALDGALPPGCARMTDGTGGRECSRVGRRARYLTGPAAVAAQTAIRFIPSGSAMQLIHYGRKGARGGSSGRCTGCRDWRGSSSEPDPAHRDTRPDSLRQSGPGAAPGPAGACLGREHAYPQAGEQNGVHGYPRDPAQAAALAGMLLR